MSKYLKTTKVYKDIYIYLSYIYIYLYIYKDFLKSFMQVTVLVKSFMSS